MRNPLLDDAMRRQATDRLPVERHGAIAQRDEARYDAHQRGLAGAVRSDHPTASPCGTSSDTPNRAWKDP